MSIIRTGIIVVAAIMLLPTDQKSQGVVNGVAHSTLEQTVGFCERNPATCQAGGELWALFLRKAEFAMELAANLIRQQLARGTAPDQQPVRTPADVRAQPRQMTNELPNARPATSQAHGYGTRQSLTDADRHPPWRGVTITSSVR